MSQITLQLQANVWSETAVQGDRVALLSMANLAGVPIASVNLEVVATRGGRQVFDNAPRGLKVRLLPAAGELVLVRLRAAVAAVVSFVASDQVEIDQTGDGNTVQVSNAPGGVLQVANDRGAVGNPVYVSALTGGTPAVSMTHSGPIAVAGAAVNILAALTTRKTVRIGNIGAGAVALGPIGITWADRAVVLQPGDVWFEDQAANLAWYAIADGTTAASITLQEVLA